MVFLKGEEKMENVCPGCGYEKCPEEWSSQLCSDCSAKVDNDDDWFR
jgi:DNA-directed RNA polymerase subunit RPC12/RpoP